MFWSFPTQIISELSFEKRREFVEKEGEETKGK